MSKKSDKSIGEIVEEAQQEPEPDMEPDDETLAAVEVESSAMDNPLRWVDPEAVEFYPTLATAREQANIPPHIKAADLVGKRFLLYSKKVQKAAVPDSGELRDGFFCTCVDIETKKPFTTWLGQVALIRDLSALTPPFQVTIVKHGRTYRFE